MLSKLFRHQYILVLLLLLVVLAALLRFWQLSQIPAILNRDEAALGYNAYLLQQTGKDEWGQRWPVALQSFGDYKLIGYPLTVIASFAAFGVNDWAVKFPSALAGVLLVAASYWWARRSWKWSHAESLLLAGLVAIQPIFFFFSRIAFEANVALLFFVVAWGMLLGRRRLLSDVVAILLLLAAVFTYNTPLLLLPFLIPVLIWWRGIRSPKRWLPALAGLFIVLAIGGASLLSLSKQKSGITIFSDENVWLASVQYHDHFHGLAQKVVGNKAVFYGQLIGQHIVATFSPEFLVIKGGAHPWHQLPGWGHFFWITYVLGWVGIVVVVWQGIIWLRNRLAQRKSELKKQGRLTPLSPALLLELKTGLTLIFLLIVSTLSAAITVDAPHATRSLFFFFIWVNLAVLGARSVWQKVGKRGMVIGIIVVATLMQAVPYYQKYFRDYGQESVAILRGNFAPAIQAVNADPKANPVAIIDDGGYQYILTAWYLHLSPTDFFATIQKQLPDRIGFRYGYMVAKYRFIKQPTDHFPNEKTLLEWNESAQTWQRKDL